MTGLRSVAVVVLACLAMVLFGGCHGGSTSNAITIQIVPPSGGTSVDVGAAQPLNFTAQLSSDTKSLGVTWTLTGSSCSGDGCGTLPTSTPFSVSYLAPTALSTSSALSVTLTATSVAQSSVTSSVTITVNPLPAFANTNCNPPGVTIPSCGLPGAANGQTYSQSIAITGGVKPYTFAVTSGSAQLTSACLNLTATQTTNPSTVIAGNVCNTTQMTATFTVQVTDSGGATPVAQTYTIAIAAAPALSILTTSLPTAYLNTDYSGAVVPSGGVPPYTWSFSPSNALPPGLSFNSTNGQISGTPTSQALTESSCSPAQAGQYCFTAQVTDSARLSSSDQHQTATQSLSITVQQPPPLAIATPPGALPAGATGTAYNASLQAMGGIQPYTWVVTQGQLPPGVTLSTTNGSTGTLSGVPAIAGNYSFTVEVSDSENVPATATASYSIEVTPGANNNKLFNGQYSFLFKGFDKDGPVSIIGTITADGNGYVTSGIEEISRMSGVVLGASVVPGSSVNASNANASTYSIDSNGDGRGTLQLTITYGTTTPLTATSVYQLVLEPDGSARIFQDQNYPSPAPTQPDQFSTHGVGVLKPVPGGVAFGANSFSGNYAFEFTGEDSGASTPTPVALAGVVHADGVSQLSPGTDDFNDGGNTASGVLSGNFAIAAGNVGTATLTLEVPAKGLTTLNFAYIFVSPSDMYFIESDQNNSGIPTEYGLSGEMILQQANVSFGQNALSGGSVATGTGLDGSGNATVMAGLLTSTVCDGTTQNNLVFDRNDGGAVAALALSGTCTVTPNGRVTFNWIQPPAPAPAVTPPFTVAYLTGRGQGFVMSDDASVTTGALEQQVSAATFATSSIRGNYTLSAPFAAESHVNNLLGQLSADGAGTFTGTVDEVDSPGTTANLDQSLTATIGSLASNGRGTMTTTAPVPPGFPTNWIFYVVSAGQIRAIPADTTNQHPELIFLGP